MPRSEVLKARGYTVPNSNGKGRPAPAAVETHEDATRRCEVCAEVLKPTQKRACSSKCARTLGSRSHANTSTPRAIEGLWLNDLLTSLPAEVTAIELIGWRCERA
jgi:hypothetical protein